MDLFVAMMRKLAGFLPLNIYHFIQVHSPFKYRLMRRGLTAVDSAQSMLKITRYSRLSWPCHRCLSIFIPIVVLVGASSLNSAQGNAQWGKSAISQVRSARSAGDCLICLNRLIGDPYLQALIDDAYIKMSNVLVTEYNAPNVEHVSLDDDFFVSADGLVRTAAVHIWKSQKTASVSPVVFYLPGLFQSSQSDAVRYMGTLLAEAGLHVVVVDNPLSIDYRRQSPVSLPAHLWDEAVVIGSIIRSWSKDHAGEYSSIHLLGVSYGAFLASMVVAQDAESTYPAVTGQTTLMFPPFSLTDTINLMDAVIAYYTDSVYPVYPKWFVGKYIHDNLINLMLFTRKSPAGSSVYQMGSLISDNEAEKFMDAPSLHEVIDGHSVRFSLLLKEYLGEKSTFYCGEQSHLSYWLDKSRGHGNSRIRILSSADEWINNPADAGRLPAWFVNESHLLLLEVGGHASILREDWFSQIIVNFTELPADSDGEVYYKPAN